MDKARKKCINLEQWSSEEIFTMLGSINSNDENEVDHMMDDSDIEFVSA